MDARQAVGRYGEGVAARHVESLGYRVLARNWRCTAGEIDLVALDGATVVIIEVKTRRSTTFGLPVEAITSAKALRLRRLAAAWLAQADIIGVAGVRIDAIGILIPPRGAPTVDHRREVA